MTTNILSLYTIYLYALYFMVFWCIVLPAGSVFGVNVKFILAFFMLGLFFLCDSRKKFLVAPLIILLLFYFFVVMWMLLGMFYGYQVADVLEETKLFSSTGLLVYLCYMAVYDGILDTKTFLKFIVNCVFIYAFLKVFFTGLIFFKMVEISFFKEIYFSVFGQSFITMCISSDLWRMAHTCDIFLPVAVFLILNKFVEYKKTSNTLIVLSFFILAIFFSYTRFIWGYFVFVLCISFFENRMYRHYLILFGIIIAILVPILADSKIFDVIGDLITQRFAGAETLDSDLIRQNQFYVLCNFWLKHPFFGWGMGSHVVGYIRSETYAFSYEIQWLSFLYKFGIVGILCLMAFIFIPVIVFLNSILKEHKATKSVLATRQQKCILSSWCRVDQGSLVLNIGGLPSRSFSVMLLYAFFLIGGFTNPILFTAPFAIVSVVVLLLVKDKS